MKRWRPSLFLETFHNLTRRGSELRAELYDPEKQVTAFEEVVRLMRCSPSAEVAGGDHLYLRGAHYVVSPHSETKHLRAFRLISLPDQLIWTRAAVSVQDPVTGLYKQGSASPTVSSIWAREITKGFTRELPGMEFERRVRRFVLSEALSVGDLLEGTLIKRVWVEQGVTLAET